MCISRPSPGEHLYQKNLAQPAVFLSFCDSQLRPVSPCEYASGLSSRVRRFRRSYGVRRRWWCSDPGYLPLPRASRLSYPPLFRPRASSLFYPPSARPRLPFGRDVLVEEDRSDSPFVRPRPPSRGAGEAFSFPLFAEVASTPSAIPSFSTRRGRLHLLR